MDEKRKFPRLNIAVDVAWEKASVQKNTADSIDPDKTRDISEGGICLIVYENVNVGDRLHLDIQLPTQKVIRAEGRVVWCTPFDIVSEKNRKRFDVGIEFLKIAPQDREEIKHFVFNMMKG